ncbi:hypothetical protein RRG08_052215 [Elysia crispata]|uniref:Uncharacterized protein n=1 Tax=Elysia crispata TaxID=231223 RepID=A0AAE1B118_9GAST|nr:hypothetical protein RRG08_052215 [Elysia crispata]
MCRNDRTYLACCFHSTLVSRKILDEDGGSSMSSENRCHHSAQTQALWRGCSEMMRSVFHSFIENLGLDLARKLPLTIAAHAPTPQPAPLLPEDIYVVSCRRNSIDTVCNQPPLRLRSVFLAISLSVKEDWVTVYHSSMSSLQLPCKVCQEPATGVHYGVLSCDACKGFFGRQLKSRGRNIVCPHNKNCNIFKNSRKHVCAPCRFNKCIEAGMSKEAIKTGRYSLKLKQSFQDEVQQSERRHAQHPAAWPNTATGVDIDYHHDLDDYYDDDNIDDESYGRDNQKKRMNTNLVHPQPNTRLGVNGETVAEIIHTILQAYPIVPSNLRSPQIYLDKIAQDYLEQYELKEKLFGKMSSVSTEDFTEIFTNTGLDVDDRIQLTDTFLNSVRGWSRRLVSFSKSIPGFKQLPLEDQFNLLKYNQYEFRFIGVYKGFHPNLEVVVNPNGFCFHKEEIPKIQPSGFNDELFEVAKSLRRTKLSPEEHIIVQTIALFFSDRAPLKNRCAVEALQTNLFTCLEFLINQRPSPPDRFRGLSHAMDMLTIIRRLSLLDDISWAQEGWFGHLTNVRLKFLEEEMENVTYTNNF